MVFKELHLHIYTLVLFATRNTSIFAEKIFDNI